MLTPDNWVPTNLVPREQLLYRRLLNEGADEILRSGWPDFAARIGNTIRFYEVKSETDKLNAEQNRMYWLFRDMGYPVEICRITKADLLEAYPGAKFHRGGSRMILPRGEFA